MLTPDIDVLAEQSTGMAELCRADKGVSVAAIVNEILYRALPWASLPIDQTRCH